MSQQSTQNPTPTVQVKEVGLPEQASVGKVLLIAGAAAGATAGLLALVTEKEQTPPSKTESAREYLRNTLDEAQKTDFGQQSRKQRKRAEKAMKKQREKARKDADKLRKQGREVASESADAVRHEVSAILDSIRSGNMELDRMVEGFAESELMKRFREFGEEAREMAEQGKKKGSKASRQFQKDVLPEAKKAAKEARKAGKKRFEEVSKHAREDFIPEAQKQASDFAKHAREDYIPEAQKQASQFVERAREEFIPEAQKYTSEFAEHARETAEHLGEDAEKFWSETSEKAEEKRKEATKAVQKGGRETRSLLLWLALAGILIFTVFLDEDQQKKLKEVAFEVFGEARDMYSDMKGDTSA